MTGELVAKSLEDYEGKPICRRSGKVIHRSRKAAMRSIKGAIGLRAYKGECGHWHLASTPKRRAQRAS